MPDAVIVLGAYFLGVANFRVRREFIIVAMNRGPVYFDEPNWPLIWVVTAITLIVVIILRKFKILEWKIQLGRKKQAGDQKNP